MRAALRNISISCLCYLAIDLYFLMRFFLLELCNALQCNYTNLLKVKQISSLHVKKCKYIYIKMNG